MCTDVYIIAYTIACHKREKSLRNTTYNVTEREVDTRVARPKVRSKRIEFNVFGGISFCQQEQFFWRIFIFHLIYFIQFFNINSLFYYIYNVHYFPFIFYSYLL